MLLAFAKGGGFHGFGEGFGVPFHDAEVAAFGFDGCAGGIFDGGAEGLSGEKAKEGD